MKSGARRIRSVKLSKESPKKLVQAENSEHPGYVVEFPDEDSEKEENSKVKINVEEEKRLITAVKNTLSLKRNRKDWLEKELEMVNESKLERNKRSKIDFVSQ